MKTAIRKWGNSLGLRLPKGIAEQLGLKDGSSIELELVAGGVLLKPSKVRRSRYSIDELLRGVSRQKIHPLEEETPVGREVW
ncbi:MAG TPA: AbrB/MazE/SpoVT family DNA-binding domain-containing protein [Meiothermus sp.]|nr:AbrB/MazE/SpoVT family DNA-binding domain-containing protein [Meiothermus sp.]